MLEGGGTEVGGIGRYAGIYGLSPPSPFSLDYFGLLIFVQDVLTLWHVWFKTGFFEVIWIHDSRFCKKIVQIIISCKDMSYIDQSILLLTMAKYTIVV